MTVTLKKALAIKLNWKKHGRPDDEKGAGKGGFQMNRFASERC